MRKKDIMCNFSENPDIMYLGDIPDFSKLTQIKPITKGWLEDKKYCLTKTDGAKFFLRVTPLSRYETRESLFEMLKQVAALDIPMCVPLDFGTCSGGVYSLQSWIYGEDLEVVLPTLSETEQYALGLKSGEVSLRNPSISFVGLMLRPRACMTT